MKKNYFLGLILVAGLCSAQYSNFSGTGNVNGSEGWVSHSGTANQIQKLATSSDTGNSLSYTGFSPSSGNRISITDADSEDINLAFTTAVTSAAYASFLLKVTNVSTLQPNTLTTPPGYFAMFSNTAGTSVTDFVTRVSLRQGSAANTFNIGIVNTTGGIANETDVYGSSTPANYSAGTTYLVVIKYDMTGTKGKSSIFINPAISSTEPTPTNSSEFGTSSKKTSIASIALRQGTKTGIMEIDEVRLGATWASVVGANLAVNDLSVAKKALISNTLVKDNFRMLTSGNAEVQIFSSTGSLVRTLQTKSNELVNISSLPKGMYVLKIKSEDKVSTVKISKN